MKIMIRCDMEGLTGMTRFEQCEPGGDDYPSAVKMLMSDLNAVVAGLKAGGATHVAIYDMHYYGTNIAMDELDADVEVIANKAMYEPGNAGGLDSSFDGMSLVGLHAKAGAPGGLLAHSYEHETQDIRVNGAVMGEIGVEAAIAGDFGVPLILMTGDSKGAEEAEATIEGVVTVTVKESIDLEEGKCYAAEETAKRLEEGAKRAMAQIGKVKPYAFAPPIVMEIDLAASDLRDRVKARAPRAFVSEGTLRLEGLSVTDAWWQYLKIKTG